MFAIVTAVNTMTTMLQKKRDFNKLAQANKPDHLCQMIFSFSLSKQVKSFSVYKIHSIV